MKKQIVIIGGGFGGLRAARALKSAPVEVTLIDRRNHHIFQPLLYQVATGSLAEGEVAAPLRSIFRRQKNTRVLLGEVVDVDPAARNVVLADGAAPTGVELAGAIGEIARETLRNDFRSIHPEEARILLVDGAPRVLPPFPEDLSRKAAKTLSRLGVEMKTGVMVKQIDQQGLVLQPPNGAGTERVEARTVLWAGGVTVPPFAKVLAKRTNAATDKTGKVKVGADLTIPGHPDIFVIGDLATGADGKPFQGVAQVAMQQGTYAGKVIARRLLCKEPLPPFKYFDKGTMAVIGRAAAVANVFGVHLAGLPAWLIWSLIHIMYLVQFQSRFVVFLKWAIQDLTFNRGSRLITGKTPSDFNFDREVARATAAALAPAPQAETKAPASAGAKT